MKYYLVAIFVLIAFLAQAVQKKADPVSWPREIRENKQLVTLYQPQLESLNGNTLEGRMALSVRDKDDELVFGALWFNVVLSTDKESRMAVLQDLEIPIIKFPDVEDEQRLDELKSLIINNLESANLQLSIEQIRASVETVEAVDDLGEQLSNDSPMIYFRKKPTVLVSIDGEPILVKSDDSSTEYVVNSPFFIAQSGKNYYLKGGTYWYQSKKIVGEDWTETQSVPNAVQLLAEKRELEDEPEQLDAENTGSPDIISVDEPAELVVLDGEPKYEPVKQTSLLYIENTESDILMDINSQEHFLLLNGRWYASKTLKDGNWNFVEPDKLPADFAQIPSDTTGIASVRVSVPGTPEANDALVEQYIPQTATVDRKTASVSVSYDGEPEFQKIEGTDMSTAVNTESTVLKVGKQYYCVDQGVWFVASSPHGQWQVADSRPEEVEQIPPGSPAYNVKYVYIYDSTPDVVYVGYTPGYYHSYVYNGVVVYGTGYYYRPWYHNYYYPRPVTYGFGVHYNPYTGWGFSMGISYGWVSMSYHPYYWGPAGYRYGYRHGYYHHHHHHHYYNRPPNHYYGPRHRSSNNVYQHRSNGVVHTRNNTRQVNNRNVRPSSRPNNVYTDRNGNVYQRDANGSWTQKNKRTVNSRPTTREGSSTRQRPATRPATSTGQNRTQTPSTRQTRPTTQQQNRTIQRSGTSGTQGRSYMNSQYQNRSRGNSNYQNYQRSRTPSSRSGGRGSSGTQQRSSGSRR